MEWTSKDVLKLIKSYRRFECLWNYRNPSYKCFDQKRDSWAQISKEIGKEVVELKRKIKHLRTAYVAEKKKVDASRKISTSPDDIYESNLFYFKELRFLDSCIVLRKTDNSFVDDSQKESRKHRFNSDYHAKNEEVEVFEEECHSPEFLLQASSSSVQTKHNSNSQSIPSYTQPTASPSPTISESSAAIEEVYIPSYKRSKTHKNVNSKHNATMETILKSGTSPKTDNIYTYFTKGLALQLQQLPIQDATETMNEIHTLVTKKLLKSMATRNGRDSVDMLNDDMKFE